VVRLLAASTLVPPAGGLGHFVPQALGVPAEWRIGFLILAGAALWVGPGPFLLHQASRAAELLAAGIVALLLFGEYRHTQWRLRSGTAPHPLAYWLDSGLEAGFGGVHTFTVAAAEIREMPRQLGRWWLLVAAIAFTPTVLSLVWLVPSPPSSLTALASTTEAVWRPIDNLVMTGNPQAVPARTLASCPAGPAPTRPVSGGSPRRLPPGRAAG
jgi:hypothetical protein